MRPGGNRRYIEELVQRFDDFGPLYARGTFNEAQLRSQFIDDPANPNDVAQHDRMVSLVEKMLDLHHRLPAAATEHQRRLIEAQIEATDRGINALVYALYDLTPDEIAVVDAAIGGNST